MLTTFFQNLTYSFSITGPIFLVLILGMMLRWRGFITDSFVDIGTRLVFNITLPCLLFISISKTNIEQTANLGLIVYGVLATLGIYLLLEFLAARIVFPREDRGVVIQGAFRSNLAIIGLAYIVNAYGEIGLAAASLYLGVVTILYNVLGVITLNRSLNQHRSLINRLKEITKNPLILSILLALPVAWAEIPLPQVILKTGDYFAQMTLPLALLCTGASLNIGAFKNESANALLSATGKLFLVPLVFTLGGLALGFQGIDLGVIFFMSSAPSAAASYIMVKAMGGNSALAANIIGLTTLGSLVVTSAGITLLHGFKLM